MNIELVKHIVDLNKQADRLFGGLKYHNLSIYLDKAVALFQDESLPAAVIIIDNIHSSRVDEIKKNLVEKSFAIPVEVRINFLDGSDLVCKFGKKATD
jgi:hypothetical protein